MATSNIDDKLHEYQADVTTSGQEIRHRAPNSSLLDVLREMRLGLRRWKLLWILVKWGNVALAAVLFWARCQNFLLKPL